MKLVIPDSQVHSPPAWIGRKEDLFLDSPYSRDGISWQVESLGIFNMYVSCPWNSDLGSLVLFCQFGL